MTRNKRIEKQIRKWKYGIYFLLLIPSFAFIYTLFPHGFYQSTVVQEGIIRDIDQRFSTWIKFALQERLVSEKQSSKIIDDLRCAGTGFVSTEIVSATIAFETSARGDRIPSTWANVTLWDNCSEDIWHQVLFNINLDVRHGIDRIMLLTNFLPDSEEIVYSGPKDFYMRAEIDESRCDEFTIHFNELIYNDGICGFKLNEMEARTLNKLMLDYRKSIDGEIYGSKAGRVIRMLYLSTVTVTTLGYGDIVPITNITRLLISLQSIFGLVLMGLFLDSIVRNRQQASIEGITKR